MKLFEIAGKKKPDVDALARKGDVDSLIRALCFPDPEIQRDASAALAAVGERAVRPLIARLGDQEMEMRLGCIEVLAEIGDSVAVLPLLRLLDDEHFEVRWAAALALGKMNDPRAIEPLVLMLVDPNRYVRNGAAIALERLGWQPARTSEQVCDAVARQEWERILPLGQRAIDSLVMYLQDEDAEVRGRVAELLGRLGGDRAREFCRMTLADPNPGVRWRAVLSGLSCGLSHHQLPLGVSRRKRGDKDPRIAAFLNFIFPGMGYQYSGTLPPGAGIALWQAYLLFMLIVLLFVHGGFPVFGSKLAFFTPLYPLYGWIDPEAWLSGANALLYVPCILLGMHAWHRVVNAPDVL